MTADHIELRRLLPDDVPQTAGLLTAAFADNPCYAWMHPRARTRERDLRAFFERNLWWHAPLDLTWVTAAAGRIVGTITLEPPGGVPARLHCAVTHWLLPTARHQGFAIVRRIVAADLEFKRHYRAVAAASRYWHVHAVAVHPNWQGRGVGSRMLDGVMIELDRLLRGAPAPVVLSTQRERNLPLYRRAGFDLVCTRTMGRMRGEPGYESWFMRRGSR